MRPCGKPRVARVTLSDSLSGIGSDSDSSERHQPKGLGRWAVSGTDSYCMRAGRAPPQILRPRDQNDTFITNDSSFKPVWLAENGQAIHSTRLKHPGFLLDDVAEIMRCCT